MLEIKCINHPRLLVLRTTVLVLRSIRLTFRWEAFQGLVADAVLELTLSCKKPKLQFQQSGDRNLLKHLALIVMELVLTGVFIQCLSEAWWTLFLKVDPPVTVTCVKMLCLPVNGYNSRKYNSSGRTQ